MGKKIIIRKPRKNAAPKIYNAGTMTSAAFWQFIRSAMRQKSRWWKPITIVKNRAKRAYNGTYKRQKFEYLCSHCFLFYPDKKIAVHHKVECGTLSCADDLPGFVMRLFCEEEGLEVICDECHDKIHKKEKL